MTNRSKQKGTSAETAVTNHLLSRGIHAKRNPPQGSNDKGDIDIYPLPIAIEVKNCQKMELSTWLDEAAQERDNAHASVGVIWHKRPRKQNPGEWYVTMSGEDFVKILLNYHDAIKSEKLP